MKRDVLSDMIKRAEAAVARLPGDDLRRIVVAILVEGYWKHRELISAAERIERSAETLDAIERSVEGWAKVSADLQERIAVLERARR